MNHSEQCLLVCSITLVATILVLITVVANHRRHHQTLEMIQAAPIMLHTALLRHDAIKGELTGSGLAGDRLQYGTSSDGQLKASTLSGDRLPQERSGSLSQSSAIGGRLTQERSGSRKLEGSSAILQRARAAVKDVDINDLV